jgi:hypothetical protein
VLPNPERQRVGAPKIYRRIFIIEGEWSAAHVELGKRLYRTASDSDRLPKEYSQTEEEAKAGQSASVFGGSGKKKVNVTASA